MSIVATKSQLAELLQLQEQYAERQAQAEVDWEDAAYMKDQRKAKKIQKELVQTIEFSIFMQEQLTLVISTLKGKK